MENLQLRDPNTNAIFQAVLESYESDQKTIIEIVRDKVGVAALEKLFNKKHVQKAPTVFKNGDFETAQMQVQTALDVIASRAGLSAEIAEAAEELSGVADEAMTWRLGQAAEAHNKAKRSENEDKAEYDTGDNGARIKRDERNALDALLDQINYSKPRK